MLDLALRRAVNAAGRHRAGRNREGCVLLAQSNPGAGPSRSRRGAILVGVLWILVFLGFLAVVLRIQIGSVVVSVRVTEDKAAARIIAEAGLARGAGLVLAAPYTAETTVEDQMQSSVETETGKVSVVMTNEAWRIDLNAAEKPLVVAALRVAGAETGLADTLAERIIERRGRKQPPPTSPDPTSPDPTAPQEAGAADDAPPADADPLQTVSEVALIEGMPESVALAIQPYVTVSSGLKGVRLEQLDSQLLRAIPSLSASIVGAIERYRRGALSRAQLDALLVSEPLSTGEMALSWRALLSVDLPAGHSETHEALIIISPDDNAPYRIIDWRRVPDDGQ